ncbi:MAG TPA: hypothetical protein VGH27_20615 [Streptosporangiaceae bacterium]|jgi:hypothetical protein
MIRRVALAGITAAALPLLLLVSLLVSGPANAGTSVGCLGPTCSLSLSQLITLRGSYTNGVGSATEPVDVPPPPCLWEPIGDTTAGAHFIINEFPQGASQFGVTASVAQAKKQLKHGGQPAGTWYELPINPAAGAAGAAACLKLPLFYFVEPGQALPAPPVPVKTLADYAYNHITIPSPTLTVNPANRGYVNLASYVWANWGAPIGGGGGNVNADGDYWVSATLLNSNESATVWAQPGKLSIQVNGPGRAYSSGCGIDGSRYPKGKPPASAGPGVTPDCGVMWTGTDAQASITASVTFKVSWGPGILNGPGPNALPDITITSAPIPVSVAQIQNLNN